MAFRGLWLLVLWCCTPLAQAKTCQEEFYVLEERLFHEPNNHDLQLAMLAMGQCEDAATVVDEYPEYHQLQVAFGYAQNPLHNTSADSIFLTTTAGPLLIPNQQRPLGSWYEQLQWQYHALPDSYSELRFQANVRQYQNTITEAQYQGGVDYSRILNSDLKLHLAQYWANVAGTSLKQTGMALETKLTPVLSMGVEWRVRRFVGDTMFDGNVHLLTMQWQPKQAWWMRIAAGFDTPSGDRAGGSQQLQELSGGAVATWGMHKMNAVVYARLQQDQQGYSALLDNNHARMLSLWGAALHWQLPIWQGVIPVVQLEYMQQVSNIALFEWQDIQLRFGIQKEWSAF